MYLTFLKDYSMRALEVVERAKIFARHQKAREKKMKQLRDRGLDSEQQIEPDQDENESPKGVKEADILSNLKEYLAKPESCIAESEKLYGLPILWSIL